MARLGCPGLTGTTVVRVPKKGPDDDAGAPGAVVAGPRERAARTKRERTRRALLGAARTLLEERGWHGTRMEDVAAHAGVSSATTYNHFPTKGLLVAHVCAPMVAEPVARARAALDAAGPDAPVAAALVTHVHDLSAVLRHHEALSVTLLWSVQEHVARVRRAPDPSSPDADCDPRVVVPATAGMCPLLERGQATGELRPFPPGAELANHLMTMLLVRTVNRRAETAAETAEMALTTLFAALRPEDLVAAGPTGRPFARPPG